MKECMIPVGQGRIPPLFFLLFFGHGALLFAHLQHGGAEIIKLFLAADWGYMFGKNGVPGDESISLNVF